jgi:hypothetical protein
MSLYPGPYKFVVEFEKFLTRGVLNGLTIKDRVHFTDQKEAERWVNDVQRFDKGARYTSFKVKATA